MFLNIYNFNAFIYFWIFILSPIVIIFDNDEHFTSKQIQRIGRIFFILKKKTMKKSDW